MALLERRAYSLTIRAVAFGTRGPSSLCGRTGATEGRMLSQPAWISGTPKALGAMSAHRGGSTRSRPSRASEHFHANAPPGRYSMTGASSPSTTKFATVDSGEANDNCRVDGKTGICVKLLPSSNPDRMSI